MYQIYQVLPSDNLNEIANKFNTTVDNLININGFNDSSELIPGNYIVVPKLQEQYFETYIVKKGDNLYEIAKHFGTDTTTIELLNGLNKNEYIYPNQELLIPLNNVAIYVTTENDTLTNVTEHFQTSIEELLNTNKQLYLSPDQIIIYKRPKNE